MRQKKHMVISVAAALAIVFSGIAASADDTSDLVLKLLIKKGIITQQEVDEMKAEVAKEKPGSPKEAKAEAKAPVVPEWVQNIKLSGDVRYRTRGDWGKPAAGLSKQEWRNSVRARFALEAKINDFAFVGARIAGGGGNPRSLDDTLNNYWSKSVVYFDQYYFRLEAPKDLLDRYGSYMSSLKFWAGRFPNPFEYVSELEWDVDITPGGVALQYVSPKIACSYLPKMNTYGNFGMLWVDENATINTDPILFGYQAGFKTDKFGIFDSTINCGAAFYDYENLKNKTPNANSAGTNARVWKGDFGDSTAVSSSSPLLGTYKYEFAVLDVFLKIDNEKVFDYAFPHGFMGAFLHNSGCSDDTTNNGYMGGGYIGKAKIKEPNDWKASCEWRYLERNAIPDFVPDATAYGFGTYTASTAPSGVNGLPVAGGTNMKGIKLAFEYQLFKNISLASAYYWCNPIKSFDKRDPWNELYIDIVAKF